MDERLDPRKEVAPALVGLQLRASPLPLGEVLVAPEARVRGEGADRRGEDPDQAARMLLLQRDALVFVQAHELGEPAGKDVVSARLDDHRATPPRARDVRS